MGLTDRHRRGRMAGMAAGILAAVLIAGGGGFFAYHALKNYKDTQQQAETEEKAVAASEMAAAESEEEEKAKESYDAESAADTRDFSQDADVTSKYAILIDVADHRIVAQRNAETRMNPASMTKVLTILVAAENIDPACLDEEVEISQEANDYAYINDCSTANFIAGDRVTVRDLFYGTILPSGGEAAYQLALYTSGNYDTFITRMNRKLKELGLADSAHFVNCVGIYDEDHYCTAYDMAIIMEAAMDNEICREVLSAHTYTTSGISVAPEGETISNKFLRRIEDKYTEGIVIGAKTGYTTEAGNCAVSYATAADGRDYVCVTGAAEGAWACIRDHVEIYSVFTGDIDANLSAKAAQGQESTEVTSTEADPEGN